MNTDFLPSLIPIHAHWDATYGCNFRCSFCLSSSGIRAPNELTTSEVKAMIDKLYEAGIMFFKVLGGEPFFRRDMIEIFEYAAGKGMVLSFSTNASLIDDSICSKIAGIKNAIIYIQMSLYGYDETSYRKITGGAQSYLLAIRGLERLIKSGMEVTILVVATGENCSQMERYYRLAEQYGVKEFRITPKINIGRAEKAEGAPSEEPAIWSRLIAALKALQQEATDHGPAIRIDSRPLFGKYIYNLTGIPYLWQNCNSATTGIFIDPEGFTAPCPFLRDLPKHLKDKYQFPEKKNIKSSSFQEIWDSHTFNQFREYYEPAKNLFTINENCEFYKSKKCIPCVITPCNCMDLIREVSRTQKDARLWK